MVLRPILCFVLAVSISLLSSSSAAVASPFALERRAWRAPEYQTAAAPRSGPGAINVHLQPHSHDDLGWLKSFDEYLRGANNSIQPASVQTIYDSVIPALQADASRTFNAVEMGFLIRWLEARPPSTTAAVRALLESGQLTITNGGWSMSDEACPTYVEMADSLSLGHRLAVAMLGPAAIARVGHQADPFGHSASQGSHFTSLAGMAMMFYGRMDMEERALRWNTSASEYVWRPSRSLGAAAQSLAGFNIHGYDPPRLPSDREGRSPFNFDITQDARDVLYGPVQDNPDWEDINIDRYVAATLEIARDHALHILPDADGTVNLAWQMGTDFNYRQAIEWYRSIDRIIHYVNANSSQHGVTLLYSSPTRYMDAKLAQRVAWPLKVDDQMPYWGDNKHWTWTGYFTSRPALKGYVRESSWLFTAARQLQAWAGGAPGDGLSPANPLFALERALGTAMHHDAVTGTERQHVAYDYARQLAAGRADAALGVAAALATLTGYAAPWATCELANASIACASLEAGAPTLLLVYNPQSTPRAAQPVRVPVGLPPGVASWGVTAPDGATPIAAQLLPASRRDAFLRDVYYGAAPARGAGAHWLAFLAPAIPAHGFAAFFLEPSAAAVPRTHISTPRRVVVGAAGAADERISNGVLTLTIAAATGMLAALADAGAGVSLPLAQDFFWYNASTGNGADDGTGGSSFGQAATTYILRPNSSTRFPVDAGPARLEIVDGPIVSEARQYLGAGDWLSNVLRLWANSSAVESEWTVGPIPAADGLGKEVVARVAAGGWGGDDSAPLLWTDSNGLEMQRRELNARPSWNSTAYLYEPVATVRCRARVRARRRPPRLASNRIATRPAPRPPPPPPSFSPPPPARTTTP